MIIGVGIDMIEVARMADRLKNIDLMKKLFTTDEQIYCNGRGRPMEHYAARFAAKEAFFKALGTGWSGELEFNEVEILPDSQGKPIITCKGVTANYLKSIGQPSLHLSMSHLKDIASAVVILESDTDE